MIVRFYFISAEPETGSGISKYPAKIDRARYTYPTSLKVSYEVARMM